MSMWLNLAKVEPELLKAIRAQPKLLDALFFSTPSSETQLSGFHPETDTFGYDYRVLTAIAAGRAEDERQMTHWTESYPWLAKATGSEGEIIEEYEFCYGPAFLIAPEDVPKVAGGLAEEHWDLDLDEEDRNDELDVFEGLAPFFATAAGEGKAIIGGVS
jgi:hypothetical protein